ncbi:MAG: hypothetical protein LBQ08_02060 [Holosporaceae bacterium]|jgi:hypothetical protein|nr:hypothetical protein [Holosporaceae bacterium]
MKKELSNIAKLATLCGFCTFGNIYTMYNGLEGVNPERTQQLSVGAQSLQHTENVFLRAMKVVCNYEDDKDIGGIHNFFQTYFQASYGEAQQDEFIDSMLAIITTDHNHPAKTVVSAYEKIKDWPKTMALVLGRMEEVIESLHRTDTNINDDVKIKCKRAISLALGNVVWGMNRCHAGAKFGFTKAFKILKKENIEQNISDFYSDSSDCDN